MNEVVPEVRRKQKAISVCLLIEKLRRKKNSMKLVRL